MSVVSEFRSEFSGGFSNVSAIRQKLNDAEFATMKGARCFLLQSEPRVPYLGDSSPPIFRCDIVSV